MSKARGPYRVDPLGYKKKADEALNKKAENARELGLDYEPVWGSGPTNKDYEDAMRQKRLHQLTSPPAQYSDIVSDGGLDPRNKFDQPAQQEPVAFEEWLAKQHGDPEEIGFLQALRIAYIAGQDSITSPPAQRKPLTDEEIVQIELGLRQYNNRDTYDLSLKDFARAIEAKLKEKNT